MASSLSEFVCTGEVDWNAISAVVTALALTGAFAAYWLDRLKEWRRDAMRRQVVAAGLLHAVTLTRNHLRGVALVLDRVDDAARRRVELGQALLHHEGHVLAVSNADIAVYGGRTAADLAYAVALIGSIDTFARWLSSDGNAVGTPEQQETVAENLRFFAEAARQAVESLDAVEQELLIHVPRQVRVRRFGPGAQGGAGLEGK